MKPIEFTFEAKNKRGEKHLYGVNMNHALISGFINKHSAVEIAFGSIRPLDNELDLDEAIYIGTQCEEIRGLFYNLLGLATSDLAYAFLLDGMGQSFSETALESNLVTHLEVSQDGRHSYVFRFLRVSKETGAVVNDHTDTYPNYRKAVKAFIEELSFLNPKYVEKHYCPQEAVEFLNLKYNAWELPVPINEEL